MSAPVVTRVPLPVQVILQQCKQLGLPAVASHCARFAERAERAGQPYLAYLDALLGVELEEREQRAIARRLREAHFPAVKTLDGFDFAQAPAISAAQLATLAAGDYLARAEPVIFLGDSGTGKTHLLTALCVAACRQKRRVRAEIPGWPDSRKKRWTSSSPYRRTIHRTSASAPCSTTREMT